MGDCIAAFDDGVPNVVTSEVREPPLVRMGQEEFEEILETSTATNATVSLGVVWNMTRPVSMDDGELLTELLTLSTDFWTYHAAKLLAPMLARLLAP